jgi:hypothetical protein
VQLAAAVLDLAAKRLDADREQERKYEHHGGMPEREEEADAHRALALGHQPAGGVVDRRDVIRVEGVTHSERVGRDAGPDREGARRVEAVVMRRHEREQHEEADRVQAEHHARHARDGPPLVAGEALAQATPAGAAAIRSR